MDGAKKFIRGPEKKESEWRKTALPMEPETDKGA